MKKITLLMGCLLCLLSSLAIAQDEFFVEAGYTQAEDVFLTGATLIPLVTYEGKVRYLASDESFLKEIKQVFGSIKAEDYKNHFPHLSEGIVLESPEDLLKLYKDTLGKVQRELDKHRVYVRFIERVNSEDEPKIFITDPIPYIREIVQRHVCMKTVHDTRCTRGVLYGQQGTEPENSFEQVLSKSTAIESVFQDYGVSLPGMYIGDPDIFNPIDQILYDIFFMGAMMQTQWEGMLNSLHNQGVYVQVSVHKDRQEGIFIREAAAKLQNHHFFLQPYSQLDGGDFRIDDRTNKVWIGYGGGELAHQTTDKYSVESFCKAVEPYGISCIMLEKKKLKDLNNRLDMFFATVGEYVVYYPEAFTQESLEIIESQFTEDQRIQITKDQMEKGMANLLVVDKKVFMSHVDEQTKLKFTQQGYEVHMIDVGSFMLHGHGGGLHSLTNEYFPQM